MGNTPFLSTEILQMWPHLYNYGGGPEAKSGLILIDKAPYELYESIVFLFNVL